jgi:nickel-dependent lactate racemase
MKIIITFTLAVLLITAALIVPAFAEEALTAPAEFATDIYVGSTEPVETEIVTEVESVPFDEWLYEAIKQATPEQMEMVEKIVMGGVNALDKLGIKGFDRIRVWVEYNTATVMVIALAAGLILFFVATLLQKRGLSKQSALLHSDAKDFYKAGQAQADEARKFAEEYAKKAEAVCRECAESAERAAVNAAEVQEKAEEDTARLETEILRNTEVSRALCEEVKFLLSCSDLSQTKRDEAEAIYQRGMDALNGYKKEVCEDDENHQA